MTILAGRLSPQLAACLGEGRVHSVFHRVVNLVFQERMLTLAHPELPLMPDTLRLSPAGIDAALALRQDQPVSWQEGILQPLGLELNPTQWLATPHTPPQLTAAYLKQMESACQSVQEPCGFDRLPAKWQEKARKALADYALALWAGKDGEPAIRSVIGLGPGATPSADDGVLAISALFETSKISFSNDLLAGTSAISAKYLLNAENGFYSDPLTALVKEPTPETARALAACGATSGKDMLYALCLASRQILQEVF